MYLSSVRTKSVSFIFHLVRLKTTLNKKHKKLVGKKRKSEIVYKGLKNDRWSILYFRVILLRTLTVLTTFSHPSPSSKKYTCRGVTLRRKFCTLTENFVHLYLTTKIKKFL